MTETREPDERALSRNDLLKLAAAAGGAAVLGTRVGQAGAALSRLGAESGKLLVLDWVGYEVPQLYAPYLKKYPGEKPQFKYMTSETNALAQMSQGLKPDIVRPYVGYVRDFAESGFVQPWNPKQIPNLKQLNQDMVKAGQLQRQAVRDSAGLGLRRHPLPQRQGQAKGQAGLEPPVGRALRGQDRVVGRPLHARRRGLRPRRQEPLAAVGLAAQAVADLLAAR